MRALGFLRGAATSTRRWMLWKSSSTGIRATSIFPAPVRHSGAPIDGFLGARGFSISAPVAEDEADVFSRLCKIVEAEYNAVGAVSKWIDEGNTLSGETLLNLVNWMSRRRMYVQAFKLLICARERKLVKFSPQLFAVEMDLTSRQFKSGRVEELYNSIPEEMRTTEVNTALLSSLISHNHLGKVEKFLSELNVLDAEGWNLVLDMYLTRDKHKKFAATVTKMKETGLNPNAKTYRILLACKDTVGGFEGIESQAQQHLAEIDLDTAQPEVLDEMMESYGYLGNLEAVDRIWNLQRQKDPVSKASYVIAMKAFGMSNDVAKAEKIFQELIAITSSFASRKHNPYATMIEVYSRAGLTDEAEKLLGDKADEELKNNFWPYEYLVSGYLAKNDAANALAKFRAGVDAVKKGSTKLQYKSVMGLLALMALRRDVAEAEKVIGHYGAFFGEAEIYNQLLRVYLAADKNPGDFKERMRQRFVEPDEETEKLLGSRVATEV